MDIKTAPASVLLSLLLLTYVCVAANIFFAAPPYTGHLTPQLPYAKELRRRGHNITFVLEQKVKHMIDTSKFNTIFYKSSNWSLELIEPGEQRSISGWMKSSQETTTQQVDQLNAIEEYHDKHPNSIDLFIIDSTLIHILRFARKHKILRIINHPMMPFDFHPAMRQLHIIPNQFTKFRLSDMRGDIMARFANFLLFPVIVGMLHLTEFSQGMAFNEFSFEREVVVINSVYGFDYARPIASNFFLTGPLLDPEQFAVKNSSQMQEIEKWIQQDDRDVVYVSMGTVASLDQEEFNRLYQGVVEAINKHNQPKFKVLWSFRTRQQKHYLPNVPTKFEDTNSLRFENYVPQLQVLQHPRVKVFLSHCGSNSAHESIYLQKPLLCFPLYGDQPGVSARVQDQNVGLGVDRDHVTAEEITAKLLKLLTKDFNEHIIKQQGKVKALFEFYGGLKKAGDVAELVLNLGEIEPLLQPESHWFLEYHLDLLLVMGIPALICFWLLKKCCSCCCRRGSKKQQKQKQT